MNISMLASSVCRVAGGWPFIFYVLGIAALCTLALGFVQVRYFLRAWKYMFRPEKPTSATPQVDMNPFQAFVNTLNTSIGNGTIAGMAAAVYAGGPGSVFWVIVIGILLMAVRYSEVYLSTYFAQHAPKNTKVGGPMLYLQALPAGQLLAYSYAFICTIFGLIVGNAMQSNSISLSLKTTWGITPIVTACVLLAFISYAVVGGAKRIVKLSEMIVPVKLIVFTLSAISLLLFHWSSIVPALILIFKSAFSPVAVAGGAIGFSIQHALQFGIQRAVTATEAGLGIAAIFFGSTGSKQPVKDSIMSMLSVFVSAFVCFIVGLMIVSSGVWASGLTSTALTIAAYKTLFGVYGGWIVSFLSVAFGIGVMVSFAYITKEAWLAATNGRWPSLITMIYCLFTFGGALIEVETLWALCDVSNFFMVLLNMLGVVFLLPIIRKGFVAFEKGKSA